MQLPVCADWHEWACGGRSACCSSISTSSEQWLPITGTDLHGTLLSLPQDHECLRPHITQTAVRNINAEPAQFCHHVRADWHEWAWDRRAACWSSIFACAEQAKHGLHVTQIRQPCQAHAAPSRYILQSRRGNYFTLPAAAVLTLPSSHACMRGGRCVIIMILRGVAR